MNTGTLINFNDRPSDSPFIERVWRSHSDQAGVFHSIATCHWVIVVTHLEGKISLTVRGPETKATMADCPPQGEWFGVLFKLGTFMPLIRSGNLRDLDGVTLPNATRRSFWLNGSAWDFPDFGNMETFVNKLVRRGLIKSDRTVPGAIRGELQNLSTRTEQRRVLQVTGLTRGAIYQIERARRATQLLKQGTSSSMWFTRRVIAIRRISPGRCSDSSGRARRALRTGKSSCRSYTIKSRSSSLPCDCEYESRHNHANLG